ncbi:MAG: hypothetical protein JWN44_7209 [Myxococcales bacterium]|nr:hypothetical protein [Myxococcales bacterium]
MLKLVDLGPEHRFTRRVDAYAPVDIEIVSAAGLSIDEIFYWRSAGPNYLIEVKIVAASGLVGGVSLVLVPPASTRIVETVGMHAALDVQRGLPIVELEPWNARIGNREIGIDPALRFIDEEMPFIFTIAHDGIAVLAQLGEPASMVSNGDLSFLFTKQSELCGLSLTGLSEAELELLRASFAQ